MNCWKKINQILYTTFFFFQCYPNYIRTKRFYRSKRGIGKSLGKDSEKKILYISWGRIGDAILSTSVLKYFKPVFEDCKIVFIGRGEVKSIAGPYIDRFIEFDPGKWGRDINYRYDFFEQVFDSYTYIIGDIHLFYGGVFYFSDLMEILPADKKFYYHGYFTGKELVPFKHCPSGVIEIPSCKKNPEDVGSLHTLNDNVFYFQEILRNIFGNQFSEKVIKDRNPCLETGELNNNPDYIDNKFGIKQKSYIACQPVSNNSKKDYPLEKWRKIIASFPQETFVVLGGGKECGRLKKLEMDNVVNLCGKTMMNDVISIVLNSKFYAGLDSGLTHIAVNTGKKTLCVAQSSNYGFFFPYPDFAHRDNLKVIHAKDYETYMNSFMVSPVEPLFLSKLRGSKDVREIDYRIIVDAIHDWL